MTSVPFFIVALGDWCTDACVPTHVCVSTHVARVCVNVCLCQDTRRIQVYTYTNIPYTTFTAKWVYEPATPGWYVYACRVYCVSVHRTIPPYYTTTMPVCQSVHHTIPPLCQCASQSTALYHHTIPPLCQCAKYRTYTHGHVRVNVRDVCAKYRTYVM